MSSMKKTAGEKGATHSIKVSSEIYERILSLQGFLQVKEKKKRSMDQLIEYILSFVPELDLQIEKTP